MREQPLLALFALAYFIAFGVYGFVTTSPSTIVYLVFVGALMTFVATTHSRVRFSAGVLWGLALWGLLHMAGGLVQVDDGILYRMQLVPSVIRFDQAVHAFGFGFATLAAWQCLRLWIAHDKTMTVGVAALLALAGMGIGALNEVVEFAISQVNPNSNVGGYLNTGWDLVYNTLGCVVAALYVWRREQAGDRGRASSEPISSGSLSSKGGNL